MHIFARCSLHKMRRLLYFSTSIVSTNLTIQYGICIKVRKEITMMKPGLSIKSCAALESVNTHSPADIISSPKYSSDFVFCVFRSEKR